MKIIATRSRSKKTWEYEVGCHLPVRADFHLIFRRDLIELFNVPVRDMLQFMKEAFISLLSSEEGFGRILIPEYEIQIILERIKYSDKIHVHVDGLFEEEIKDDVELKDIDNIYRETVSSLISFTDCKDD